MRFMDVTNESDLRVAASITDPLALRVVGMVPIASPVNMGAREITRIVGATQTSGFKFLNPWNGDWAKPPVQNGLEFQGGDVELAAFTLKGFEWAGSAIKYHGVNRLLACALTATDCGKTYHAPKVAEPGNASEAFYNNVIGSHQSASAIDVFGCTFRRCALSQWDWSHVLYVSSKRVTVSCNVFDDCGNPLSLGAGGLIATELVTANKFNAYTSVKDKHGVARSPYFSTLMPESRALYARNTLTGLWAYPWTGHPRVLHVIDNNDYSRMTFEGYWAADTGAGTVINIDYWKKMGFDLNSKWGV